jgi:putative Mn2+ efflux pump MntP
MIPLQTFILAFSLSGDAFAAALEALAPLIGFLLGRQFAGTIAAVDHWIAFVLLFLIGARMVYRGFFPADDKTEDEAPSVTTIATTAAGTNIDATVVGVTLALVTSDIPQTVITIGVVTFIATLVGLRLGRILGLWAGRSAEGLGGLGLIAIGANILFTHLTAG